MGLQAGGVLARSASSALGQQGYFFPRVKRQNPLLWAETAIVNPAFLVPAAGIKEESLTLLTQNFKEF